MKIVSQNFNALGRKHIKSGKNLKIEALLQTSADIYLMQDLRLNTDLNRTAIEDFYSMIKNSVSGGQKEYLLMAHSPKHNRGVGFLINKSILLNNQETSYKDSDGNLMIIKIRIFGKVLTLANVYGPNCQDPDFFSVLENELAKAGGDIIVVGGDFNCIIDTRCVLNNQDIHNCKQIPNKLNGAQLNKIMFSHQLHDVFREQNPTRKAYTYSHFSDKRLAKSRLDFFLIKDTNPSFDQLNFRSIILPKGTVLFDHRPVELTIKSKIPRERTAGKKRTKL